MPTPQYQTSNYAFVNKGLQQRAAIDKMPAQTYWNLANSESRQENSIASRLGRHAITQDGINSIPVAGGAPIIKLATLRSLNNFSYRYAGAASAIYRRAGETDGAFTNVTGTLGLSGNRFSASPYRPSLTSFPYIFFGDSNIMLKDNGTFPLLELWGIFSPTIPPTIAISGVGGLNVTGGVPYDYRITYYNPTTGDESGPSQILAQFKWVSPVNQGVLVTWTPSPDPQVGPTRIYRRGGTLANQWLQVGEVPLGTYTFTDVLSDIQVAANNILNTDTAPPVTSTLVTPVNTLTTSSITAGVTQVVSVLDNSNMFANQVVTVNEFTPNEETVIVQSVGFPPNKTFVAFFQFFHTAGATIKATTRTGQPVSIGAIAFDRAWLAGDPNNPNILYYSERFNPESFPLENFLEIGSPSDPIIGIVEWNGQLYVFTQTTIWNVLGANGASVPLPYKTAAHHGLYAVDGWTTTDSELWFISQGGIYAFQGASDSYVSEPIEWIFTEQFIDDNQPRAVVLMDQENIGDTVMEYYQNEVYVCYTGLDGARHRVIYSKIYQRWRNDDVPANAIYLEDDSYKLLFGDTVGMIYQDRTGNFDDAGFNNGVQQIAPFTLNLQTASLDMGMPKNFKNFNELTLDIDTGGLACNVTLLFDYGVTSVPIGTVTTAGRQQVDLNINAGNGQLSLNVSLQITCTINAVIGNPVTVYEAHIRWTPEAELRKSADTYLMDFGRPDYKIAKQCWLEYMALDPAGVTFNCYIEGSSIPVYTFTVPQSLTRTSRRVRFPAVKARVWRYVASSPSDFRLYSDSRIEQKAVTNSKDYTLSPFQQPAQTQP